MGDEMHRGKRADDRASGSIGACGRAGRAGERDRDRPGKVYTAVLLAARAFFGEGTPEMAKAVEVARYLLERGMCHNIERIDSFGVMATGDEATALRAIGYVRGATPEQREFHSGDIVPGTAIVFADLDSAADVSYVLAEVAELREVYGAEPRAIFPIEPARDPEPVGPDPWPIDEALRSLRHAG